MEWAAFQPDPRDTRSLRGDLLALLRPWARAVRSRPYARFVQDVVTTALSGIQPAAGPAPVTTG